MVIVGLLVDIVGLRAVNDGFMVDFPELPADEWDLVTVFDCVLPPLGNERALVVFDLLAVVLVVQWYFRIAGSPVFIRIHFLPDALQDLKQSAIAFPSHIVLVVVIVAFVVLVASGSVIVVAFVVVFLMDDCKVVIGVVTDMVVLINFVVIVASVVVIVVDFRVVIRYCDVVVKVLVSLVIVVAVGVVVIVLQ